MKDNVNKDWENEINDGTRFEFGGNWKRFLENITDEQIEASKEKLLEWLGDINGKTFLDVGCGSGLHSLTARMLGANVVSFDYDKQSVECTKYLKEKYFPNDKNWEIKEGSVLDIDYMENLGKYDIVYSWGVLHHTGQMYNALNNIKIPVDTNGILFIAIYNTQAYWTKYWTFVKKTYNKNSLFKYFWISFYLSYYLSKGFLKDILLLKNPLKRYKEKNKSRGMSFYYDLLDWLGGYPFETAMPEEMFDFFKKDGFKLEKIKTCGGGLGCNEFTFNR
jgi:2-polyprenyl-6-hydroxyphenyl methylase/3-demethylubiquinone-9 3-methyltransferase